MPEFDFHVGGIEDGIVQVLKESVVAPNGYVKTVGTYGGELDAERLRGALDALLPQLPLILVSYGDGEDAPNPAVPRVGGEPFIVEHRCTFSVICCSGDARGEQVRRRGTEAGGGVYKMLADARRLLAGLLFRKMEGEENVLLNAAPLLPSGVEYVARLADLTAYAQHFDTSFSYMIPDRRKAPVTGVSITPSATMMEDSRMRDNLPGVVLVQ